MMKTMPFHCFLRIALIVLALIPVWHLDLAYCKNPAGKVDAVVGKVTVAGADGTVGILAKGASVFSGDIISTGPNSRVRIVFSDHGLIFLRPSSRFVIDTYQHTGNAQQDESKFSLIKGGFRAVTGAIGHANRDKVLIETPVATIGIRGTDHEARFCAGDCLDLTDIGVSAPPDGLYTATNVGQTVVGTRQFAAGQYGFTNPARVTISLAEPPPILLRDPNLRESLEFQKKTPREEKNAPTTEGQAKRENPDGEESEQGAPEEIAIPAQPPTTHTVQCR